MLLLKRLSSLQEAVLGNMEDEKLVLQLTIYSPNFHPLFGVHIYAKQASSCNCAPITELSTETNSTVMKAELPLQDLAGEALAGQ